MSTHLDALKTRYAGTLRKLEAEHGRTEEVRQDGTKLVIKASVPSNDAKNRVWDEIKASNPQWQADLVADIRVDESLAPKAAAAPAGDAGKAKGSGQTYTVKAGDTLSKIAKEFYGDGKQYMKIFEANKDKLKDPDKIQVGQTLVIP